MEEILVSINCITYNQEKYVEDAICGFINQKTDFKFELLIHDDASTDSTAEIIREYEKRYPELIKVIVQEENQFSKGVTRINHVYNHPRSKGKYIALCEGDDYWTDPNKLQKQVNYMEQHPDCGLCFHASQLLKVGEGKIGFVMPYKRSCISPMEDIIMGGGGFMATSSLLYRKSVMDNPPELFWNAPVGDHPLQLLASEKNYAYYINEVMSVYRLGVEGSWTSQILAKENGAEKFYQLYKATAAMLNEFDTYTNGKYTNVIRKKIALSDIHYFISFNKLEELKAPEYRKAFRSFRLNEKLYILSRYYKKLLLPNSPSIKSITNTIKHLILSPFKNHLAPKR